MAEPQASEGADFSDTSPSHATHHDLPGTAPHDGEEATEEESFSSTDQMDDDSNSEAPASHGEPDPIDQIALTREQEMALDTISPNDEDLIMVWRVLPYGYYQTPFSLMSPLRGLRYEPPSAAELITMLQFAVICRTDDRRHWKLPIGPEPTSLTRFMIAQDSLPNPLPNSISSIFRAIYDEDFTGLDYSLALPMRELVTIIEKQGPTAHPVSAITTQHGFNVYSVTEIDLVNIQAALRSLHTGTPGEAHDQIQQRIEEVRHQLQAEYILPRDFVELVTFHRRTWVYEQTYIELAVALATEESD
ncbi:hypothetical protein NW762_006548 [Fusarium torreyae]|uniref:Uncharacterized protein n=1 Tax=Fusarium torreyae TaxID=1237075 RepID=A0A9W8S249_9HYPO|nr:hypothetical protein NW762_006548 [Fusarium torreyae]